MLDVPERSNRLMFKSKNKKHVSFKNFNSVSQSSNEDSDEVFQTLDSITASCLELAKQNGFVEIQPDTLTLANNFQDACNISVINIPSVSTGKML